MYGRGNKSLGVRFTQRPEFLKTPHEPSHMNCLLHSLKEVIEGII